jgi:NADPH-dependent glutamate synthase beta subunit-like oxidoreductase
VVWAIAEGRKAAEAIDHYLFTKTVSSLPVSRRVLV